jgi:hypothetical protein
LLVARTYHALAYRSHFVVSSQGLYIEAIFLAIVFPALWGYLWFTRDLNLDAITPKEEITRYFTLTMWISIYTFAVCWAGSYYRMAGTFGPRRAVRNDHSGERRM